jgi:hypothetical protein
MSSYFGIYSFHADRIICHGCGNTGCRRWEDAPAGDSQLVGIEGDFYERLASKPPYPIELVCCSCGAVQPDGRADPLFEQLSAIVSEGKTHPAGGR